MVCLIHGAHSQSENWIFERLDLFHSPLPCLQHWHNENQRDFPASLSDTCYESHLLSVSIKAEICAPAISSWVVNIARCSLVRCCQMKIIENAVLNCAGVDSWTFILLVGTPSSIIVSTKASIQTVFFKTPGRSLIKKWWASWPRKVLTNSMNRKRHSICPSSPSTQLAFEVHLPAICF